MKILILLILILLSGCIPKTIYDDRSLTPYLDYSIYNYTNLNISREDFESLQLSRQRDWLLGICYPENCKWRNPPICISYNSLTCIEPNSKEDIYFKNIMLGVKNEFLS